MPLEPIKPKLRGVLHKIAILQWGTGDTAEG